MLGAGFDGDRDGIRDYCYRRLAGGKTGHRYPNFMFVILFNQFRFGREYQIAGLKPVIDVLTVILPVFENFKGTLSNVIHQPFKLLGET
jgi:hypothetical protein